MRYTTQELSLRYNELTYLTRKPSSRRKLSEETQNVK